MPPAVRFLQRHHDLIGLVAGLLLIAMGIVVFTGTMARLNAAFGFTSSGLGAKL
jgi:hypothetical protein